MKAFDGPGYTVGMSQALDSDEAEKRNMFATGISETIHEAHIDDP